MELETCDVLLIVSDADWVRPALRWARFVWTGCNTGPIDPNKFNFLWVVDFPLVCRADRSGPPRRSPE